MSVAIENKTYSEKSSGKEFLIFTLGDEEYGI
ncbi:protein of unknown function [Enterobacter cancerogenus]|nr:protein of unknown function [Enterobacter cancerogenus]